MNKSIFILPLILLLSIFIASAYSSSNLKMYYSFDEIDVNTAIDSLGVYNLSLIHFNPSSTTYSKTGLISNSRQWSAQIYNNVYCYYENSNITYNFSSGFTINMWVYDNFGYGNQYFDFGNGTHIREYSRYKYVFGSSGAYLQYLTKANTTSTQNVFINKQLPSPNNHWNMITLVQGVNSTQYYVNGGLITNEINQTLLNRNVWTLDLGWYATSLYSAHIVNIDEYSVWNTPLNLNDIAILYNSGSGLSYTDTTTNGNISLGGKCTDEFTLCNNWGYTNYPHTFGLYYCNSVAESQFCSGGCINDICYTNGIATCGIIGESKCVDSTNYGTCSDSNSDGYLDYGQLNTCALNTHCVDYFHQAQCKNVSSSGVHSQYGLITTPYAVNTNYTSFNVDTNLRTVKVKTTDSVHTQSFIDSGTNFTTRICDYKETPFYNYGTIPQLINQSTDIVMSSAVAQNSIVRISIVPSNFDNGTIQLFSQGSTSNGILRYIRNATDKSLCIYDGTGTTIYCDYDYTGSDTLKSLDLEYTFDFTSKYYTIKMYFSRTYSNIQIRYPIVFAINDIYYYRINSTNTTLNYISLVTIPQFNSFSNIASTQPAYDQFGNVVGYYFQNDCLYSSVGSYKARTYGNNDGTPDYSVYNDWNINLDGTGLTQQQLDVHTNGQDWLSGNGLTQNTKLLIILFTLLLTIGSFTAIGFTMNNVASGFTIGIIVGFFALIMFTVFDWIPAWILIVLIIIGIATVILVSKTSNNNSSG